MAAWLDRLGAAFGASVGYDVASLSMHFLSDVSDGALDYLRAVVREPAFEEEEVARVRQERLDEIEDLIAARGGQLIGQTSELNRRQEQAPRPGDGQCQAGTGCLEKCAPIASGEAMDAHDS